MIYVIRHGQTDWNKEGRLQGRRGLPLNEEGVRQAENLKQQLSHISFDYVFSSPQKRAQETAEITTGVACITDSRLDVYDLGEADGLFKREVKMDGPLPDSASYSGVEDPMEVMKRIKHFMTELETLHGKEDKNILISGHRCTTGAIGSFFNGIPDDQNIVKLSSDNGEYKQYGFTARK
ncbi:histidine phosphatase family protein [Rossellomorea vietnamensis]|uniref:histidine phosphatase family protein n=1 Tax=Rossellomorea vietnamensis TaxID=218284 RepID=UPI00077C2726|nr:histidine phosphatase family protein [Rossellomorea vietnamensis]